MNNNKITMLQVGDRVYCSDTSHVYSKYHILSVVSVDEKHATLSDGRVLRRSCVQNIRDVRYPSFNDVEIHRRFIQWYICRPEVEEEAERAKEYFEKNRDLIKANVLIQNIFCMIHKLTDEEKLGIYDLIVKSKNMDAEYDKIIDYNKWDYKQDM